MFAGFLDKSDRGRRKKRQLYHGVAFLFRPFQSKESVKACCSGQLGIKIGALGLRNSIIPESSNVSKLRDSAVQTEEQS